jgi:hypothetical protein
MIEGVRMCIEMGITGVPKGDVDEDAGDEASEAILL